MSLGQTTTSTPFGERRLTDTATPRSRAQFDEMRPWSDVDEHVYQQELRKRCSNGSAEKITPDNDCNNNNRHDACDIYFGISNDTNHNYIPDECE